MLPVSTRLTRTCAAVLQAGPNFLRTPAMKVDADAILFSAKSFAAAMLAYYLSLRIGLPKPFWAIVTVYIVSQTSAGASFSRGVYRFAGTFIGAIATVAIVPNFVNDPIVCSVILAGWIGLCLFFSLLDRTPRAYAFVLAGYTASLIGFPGVLDPSAIFDTASLRVQEISIGILCAVLIHRYVLPKPMTGHFTGRLSATLQDARRLAGDALTGTPEENRKDRHQLAVDLLTLQGLATHLPYDPASVTPRRGTLQLIHDRLARLLPLTAEIEDRVHFLGMGDGDTADDLTTLVGDVRAWIATTEADDGETAATRLIGRARSVQKHLGTDAATLGDSVGANLAGHLAEMIGLLHDCDRLRQSMNASWRPRKTASLHGPKRARGYVYHRDPWMAARAALGCIVGILSGCAFWIWSAWPEGGTAVSILGVCCTLFGSFDAPVPFVVKYIVGSIYGVLISLVYSFAILPQVTNFAVLVAVLAPAFLLAGSLQARLPTTFMAMGITLTIPILSGLGTNYTGDFAACLNTVIALFAAVGFGAVSMSLFQTVPVHVAINRLLHLSRRDVGRRALGGAPNEARWTSLMIDRTALLLPRLRASGKTCANVLDDTLRHLRIGYVAGQLRKTIPQTKGEAGAATGDLLSAITVYFSVRSPTTPADFIDLDQRIETLMAMMMDSSYKSRSRVFDLLIDLRFALGSGGTVKGGASGS
ncbi:FUSC family protein [Rhodovastum atsumiense]|uniref:FUSC family protein n=2 Tax=Rhodovastum atsumiense TaxID=504468 RepID=A0A5M6IR91_9PROT|nr:FUSC family protein [Rhodovastum atsumiense]KAA5610429.1 FUSC family protein [Rhodovastum atsumiense]CAH2602909.1 FUSC family protein [Rhodovastum atsumiense]